MHELLKCAYTKKILNMPQVLNGRVLNMQELYNVNMPEFVLNFDNRQGSEYVSCNTYCKVTLQVNEYLLSIQNSVKDLRWTTVFI